MAALADLSGGGASVSLSGDALVIIAIVIILLGAAWFFRRR